MEKITKEYKVYNFDELKEDVKEKVIERFQKDNCEDYCEYYLEDDMNDKAEELLEKYFGKDAKIKDVYYDLSYCQGSGSMIAFSINILDLNKKYKLFTDEEIRLITDKSLCNEISVYHNDNFYYHEYTFSIEYDDDFGCYDYEDIKDEYNITEKDFYQLEDRLIDFLDTYNKHNTESQFIKDIISMNKELTKKGYEMIDYDFKEESKESARNYKYLEDGTIFE